MMGLGENIREGRKRRGLTQAEVAARLEVTSAAVTQWERGMTTPRYEKLEQLARVLHMTVPELLGSVDVAPDGTTRPVAASRPVPLVATAHMGQFDPDEGAERMVQVPEEVVARHPAAYLVHGFGPCMNRRYPEDALLLVDPERPPRNGDAVYVRGELGGLVRAYYRGGQTLMLSADSWSEELEDVVVTPSDPPVEVLGTVVWYQAAEDAR